MSNVKGRKEINFPEDFIFSSFEKYRESIEFIKK